MSDEDSSLATGAILEMSKGIIKNNAELYLQVMEVHPPTMHMNNEKFKITIHDSQHSMCAILSSQYNNLVKTQQLIKGSVIQLNNYVVNNIAGQQMAVLLNMEVLQKDCELLKAEGVTPAPAHKPANSSGFGNKGGFGGNKGFGGGGFGGGFKSTGFGGQSTGGGGGGGGEYQLVSQLSPFQKDFKIKVRCTRKGPMREWSNDRGTGKLFSVDLLDSQGTEIQATCFNDVADKFYPMFEEGKVFVLAKGRIKVANKRYTHIKNDYSIDLTMDTTLDFVNDDTSIQSMRFEFAEISEIMNKKDKDYVDCCGICDMIGEVQQFTSKRTQKELTKRSFRLCDASGEGSSIECVLWGDEAINFPDDAMHKAVCCKAARVSEFNGKSLSVNKYQINPEGVGEVQQLNQWWASTGSTTKFNCLTQSRGGGGGPNEPPITLKEMEDKGFGSVPDKQDYFNLKVTIESIIHDKESGKFPWYKAVPEDDGPAYKVTPGDDGTDWFCEKNGKSYQNYKCRYVLRFRAADHTSSSFFNCYDRAGQIIMGMEAGDIEKLVDGNDEAGYAKVFDDATNKLWNFRVRAKQETYNDEARRRLDVVGATPIDLVTDSEAMLKEISALL